MQTPPEVSPDGRYWWDGREWQPMPQAGDATPVQQSTRVTARPPWLPEGIDIPSAPNAADIAQGADVGPAETVMPAPLWDQPAPPRGLISKVMLWAGVALGAAILVFGVLGVISLSISTTARSGSVVVAVVFILFGAALLASCVLRLMGYAVSLAPVGTAISSLGILGCLVLLGMTVNTIVSVTSPTGGGRYVVPWATVLVAVYRAWRGRWLATIILAVAWVVAVLITLAAGRP
jgi:hypothetical protein